jgi:hypothetical protein
VNLEGATAVRVEELDLTQLMKPRTTADDSTLMENGSAIERDRVSLRGAEQ